MSTDIEKNYLLTYFIVIMFYLNSSYYPLPPHQFFVWFKFLTMDSNL